MEGVYHVVKELKSYSKGDGWVSFECETNTGRKGIIKLEFCSPDSLRYTLLPLGVEPSESYIPLKEDWPPVDIHVEEEKERLLIKTSALSVKIDKSPFYISFCKKDGTIITREEALDKTVNDLYNVEPLGFWASGDDVTAVKETMSLAPDEHFYGFGEKFTPFDKKGQKTVMWNVDAHGVMTEKAYKNVPFFMSTKGYGIFVNSTAKITYTMGSRSNVSYSFEVNDNTLDFYFIYGPSFKDILHTYTELTGRPSVPPKWSFGLWMSGGFLDVYRTRVTAEELAEKLRRHSIPCDVLHIDPWWMKEGSWCNFEWDPDAFPNPKEMIDKLKSLGFKLSLWENPYVPADTGMFEEGSEKGYFLTKEDGTTYLIDPWWRTSSPISLVDFTNPRAVTWYKEKHKPLFEMGVAVMKTDFGEAAPEDAVFFNGETGARMHNLYPLLYNRAVFEATEEFTGRAGIVWARSGYAGSQRYPTHWSGDPSCTFASMAAALRAGLSLSLSGFPFWSHDIGGFGTFEVTTPTPELFVRWAQFGLFSPHSRCHGMKRRDPWDFGDEALSIFRFYAKLRYRLLPYIFSYAFVASKSGLPLTKPLIIDYQDDPNTYDKDLEYMFGGEILVAPIYDETGRRPIYLPKGKWIDYWTKAEYEGPTTLHYEAPLRILPLFVKGDSIIPLAPEMSHTIEKPFDEITLDIYLSNQALFTLHDEDGVTTIKAERRENQVYLNISESHRTWVARFNMFEAPETVKTNGTKLVKCLQFEEFHKAEKQCWYHDGKETLHVKIKTRGEARTIVELSKESTQSSQN